MKIDTAQAPTPRTDALCSTADMLNWEDFKKRGRELMELSRQLERELAQVHAELAAARKAWDAALK